MRRSQATSKADKTISEEIDALVREAAAQKGRGVSPEEAAEFVFERLGLPRAGLIPIVLRSIKAHLDAGPV